MNFTPYVVLWALIALATGGLALYRKLIAMNEDDYIHLAPGAERFTTKQVALTGKLDVIDRWGKVLTVITAVAGVVLGAAYLYVAWVATAAR